MGIVDASWVVVIAGGESETSRVAQRVYADDVATSLPVCQFAFFQTHSLGLLSILLCSLFIWSTHRLPPSPTQSRLTAITTSRAYAAYRCRPGADHTHHVKPSLPARPCQRHRKEPTARERAGRRLAHLTVCQIGQGQRQGGGHGWSCSR
jgi:hypothetical protein